MTEQAVNTPPNINNLPAARGPRRSPLGIILRILGNGLFVLLLALMSVVIFFIFQARLSGRAPTLFGYEIYIVYGGSMSPNIKMGSLAVVRPVDPREVLPGNIITFLSGETFNTHRIIAVNGAGSDLSFTTRGDANEVNDLDPVLPSQIRGRVAWTLPALGYGLDFARSKNGLLILIIIPGLLIIFTETIKLFRLGGEMDRKEKESAAEKRGEPYRGLLYPNCRALIGERRLLRRKACKTKAKVN